MRARHRISDTAELPLTEDETRGAMWNVWRLAAIDCGFALERWKEASKGGKARAYQMYTEALEHEARAAHALARYLGRFSGAEVDETLVAG
jgi:hypothetical protein